MGAKVHTTETVHLALYVHCTCLFLPSARCDGGRELKSLQPLSTDNYGVHTYIIIRTAYLCMDFILNSYRMIPTRLRTHVCVWRRQEVQAAQIVGRYGTRESGEAPTSSAVENTYR